MRGKNPDDLAYARRIVKWLATQNVAASVAELPKAYVVWSKRPFDSYRSEAAREFALAIEELGKTYRQHPDNKLRYDFRQRRDGQFDPYYVPAPERD